MKCFWFVFIPEKTIVIKINIEMLVIDFKNYIAKGIKMRKKGKEFIEIYNEILIFLYNND